LRLIPGPFAEPQVVLCEAGGEVCCAAKGLLTIASATRHKTACKRGELLFTVSPPDFEGFDALQWRTVAQRN
jgi:hypothetical protein